MLKIYTGSFHEMRANLVKLTFVGVAAISTAIVFLIYICFLPTDESTTPFTIRRKLVPKYGKYHGEHLDHGRYNEFDFNNKAKGMRQNANMLDEKESESDRENIGMEKSIKTLSYKSILNVSNIAELGMIRNVEEKILKQKGFKDFAFNSLVSDRIGFHRAIPDTRNVLCKKEKYPPLAEIPNASVIICFYNEAFSALLRTVYSILDRTQESLVHEILLVDDFSDNVELKDKMEQFLKDTSDLKIKYIRTPERAGLMRARIFGAHHATGKALVFLDSHCEVNENWLLPLLTRIHENRSTVACPIIDIISSDTFEYTSSPIVRGGFNWGLHFKWDSVPYHLLRKKSDFVRPISSPTMAGGLFAIDKSYFHEFGEYDRGMDIWGGENLEMSFRLWMCGGRLEIIPCSRVGHVFRNRRPYGAPSGEDTLTINSLRLAHVWMDDYIKYFFETRPEAKHIEYGDISERLDLKKQLKCKSFDWYIKNVYPDLKPPRPKNSAEKLKQRKRKINHLKPLARKMPLVVNRYQIQLSGTNFCIQSDNEVTAKGSKFSLQHCLSIKRQVWSETELNELRLADMLCLEADSHAPFLGKCHELGNTQEWKHSSNKNSPLYNLAAGLCLGARKIKLGQQLKMTICGDEEQTFKWNFLSRMDT